MKPYNKVLMDMKVKLKQLRKVSCSISVEHIDDGLFQMVIIINNFLINIKKCYNYTSGY